MNSKTVADYILVSNNIFTARDEKLISGLIAVKDNLIIAVGKIEEKEKWIGDGTKVYDLKDKLITPGFHDNHTFFTGYQLIDKGIDLSESKSEREAIEIVKNYANTLGDNEIIFGYGWDNSNWKTELPTEKNLNECISNRPVLLFNASREYCWMNSLAIEKYGFTQTQCYSEAMVHLFKDVLKDKDKMKSEFIKFSQLLASRGVTSIKDIAYDDYLGLLNALEELDNEGKLTLRVNFASQTVEHGPNFEFGKRCIEKYNNSDFLKFQGFKFMVDGIVANHTGDLLEPYANNPNITNLEPVDYDRIRRDILEADRLGFKCCLNVDGDAAARKSIDILEKCIKVNGKRERRNSLSDVNLCKDEDIKRLKELDLSVEVYPQFLLLFPSLEDAFMREFIGEEREKYFNNFGTMQKEGVRITSGTDLPLFITNIPDSIYSAVGRLFEDGKPEGGWQKDRGLTIAELLKAWTINGAYHCYRDEKIGTLEVGKLADIAVLDKNVFEVSMDKMRDVKVALTMCNGQIVYEA